MSKKDISRTLVSILALNVKGQLGKIATFFSDNNLNVLRLVLSAADRDDRIHRTVAYLEGNRTIVDNMCEGLKRVENVIEVTSFKDSDEYVEKEICLIKMLSSDVAFPKAVELVNKQGGKVIFTKNKTIIFEVDDTENNINKFTSKLVQMTKNVEISRSGVVAMSKDDVINELVH
ncbi:MAG: acetolactate synthase small subunit [Rickettsiales bacterium]|jgi:acetolactate synthase-1/3 small subunit|nr:acetolactate synthase small subunit [Rickettsiales bacterium]